MRIPFYIARASRVYSRTLVICEGRGPEPEHFGVFIVRPSGIVRYQYTAPNGTVYTPSTLVCASRNGWCLLTGPGYSLVYHALTAQAYLYPKEITENVLAVLDAATVQTVTSITNGNGSGFVRQERQAEMNANGFVAYGPGEGTTFVGAIETDKKVPAIFNETGVKVLELLRPGDQAYVRLYGGDGYYYGGEYSSGGDIRAVRWTKSGVASAVPGMDGGMIDVNQRGDILGNGPSVYQGNTLTEILVREGSPLWKVTVPRQFSLADDGSILVLGPDDTGYVIVA